MAYVPDFRAAANMWGWASTLVRGASPKSPLSGFGLLYLIEALSETSSMPAPAASRFLPSLVVESQCRVQQRKQHEILLRGVRKGTEARKQSLDAVAGHLVKGEHVSLTKHASTLLREGSSATLFGGSGPSFIILLSRSQCTSL